MEDDEPPRDVREAVKSVVKTGLRSAIVAGISLAAAVFVVNRVFGSSDGEGEAKSAVGAAVAGFLLWLFGDFTRTLWMQPVGVLNRERAMHAKTREDLSSLKTKHGDLRAAFRSRLSVAKNEIRALAAEFRALGDAQMVDKQRLAELMPRTAKTLNVILGEHYWDVVQRASRATLEVVYVGEGDKPQETRYLTHFYGPIVAETLTKKADDLQESDLVPGFVGKRVRRPDPKKSGLLLDEGEPQGKLSA